MYLENRFNYYWSNCMFAALIAKIHYGRQVKIIFIPPWKNDKFCPHFMWSDGEFVFDWYATKDNLKWYDLLWHKGHVRTRNIETYERWRWKRK